MRAFVLIIVLFAARANANVFQFLYIEASEGSSSGGHVALQLGDEVYHYQYDDGLIRLFKNNSDGFRVNYQLKQNRTIHVAEVKIPQSAYSQLQNHFKLKYFEQKQEINQIDSAQNDQALLKALLIQKQGMDINPQSSELSLKLPGAGLFYGDPKTEAIITGTTCHAEKASANILAEVRMQIENRYGKAFLAQKSLELRRLIGGLLPPKSDLIDINYYSFSEQYADLLNGMLALQVIEKTKPLTAGSCFQVDLPQLKLTDAAIKQVKAYQQKLLISVQSLLASTRPDMGYALLVILARLAAIEQSIQTGHWVFIDDSNDENSIIDARKLSLYADYLPNQRAKDLRRLTDTVSEFTLNSSSYEHTYANLEMAANRYQQWFSGDKSGEIQHRGDTALPTKSVSAINYLVTDLPKDRLLAALHNKEQAAERLLEKDRSRNTYHLLTNNCVTALFEQINTAVNGESRQLLGGYIEPKNTVIPFQAFTAVQENYNVDTIRELPAYRQQELAKLYQREVDSVVYVRESNVFSSSLYKHNPDDAWFVFFTDDALVLRPLFGAINTVAAASQSVWGLFSWPFGGEAKEIKIGARGILASLPELAFFNIRKGSYPYAINPELKE